MLGTTNNKTFGIIRDDPVGLLLFIVYFGAAALGIYFLYIQPLVLGI